MAECPQLDHRSRCPPSSGAATGDGQQHLLMLPANPSATALYEVVTSTVNDVGHLQRRSAHALRDTPLPLNLAQRHQGWLNHTRMRPPLSKRLRSSRLTGSDLDHFRATGF